MPKPKCQFKFKIKIFSHLDLGFDLSFELWN